MSSQRTNSIVAIVGVLAALIIIIWAVVGRGPSATPPVEVVPEDELPDTAPLPDDAPTVIDQTTDTTTGAVPGESEAEIQLPELPAETDLPPADIIEAAQRGEDEMVLAMIDAGADVNAADDGGRTPLMLAAAGGHVDTVFALLNSGADPAARDNARRSARDYALARNDEAGQTVAHILAGAVGTPVQDPAEK